VSLLCVRDQVKRHYQSETVLKGLLPLNGPY